jgi:polyhydroxyalkanoate synthesis regulator protein
MFERTFAMFAPFARRESQAAEAAKDAKAGEPKAGGGGDIDALKRQLEDMQKKLDRITDTDKSE